MPVKGARVPMTERFWSKVNITDTCEASVSHNEGSIMARSMRIQLNWYRFYLLAGNGATLMESPRYAGSAACEKAAKRIAERFGLSIEDIRER